MIQRDVPREEVTSIEMAESFRTDVHGTLRVTNRSSDAVVCIEFALKTSRFPKAEVFTPIKLSEDE